MKLRYRITFLYVFLCLTTLTGCSDENKQVDTVTYNCVDCHTMNLDENHNFPCTTCHKGTLNASNKNDAHKSLIAQPGSPLHMSNICASCHSKNVKSVGNSLHFTLKKSTNLFRKSFGATTNLDTFQQTPDPGQPKSALQLADDLLRRRCFNCHPFNSGNNFPLTSHGTGCSACHLPVVDGSLVSHGFSKPSDERCLSCHYGNYVGFDYYGRFEHDLNNEYRTPYTTTNEFFRPYGVEYHQLKPDIHQQKGLWCIDCHTGSELMHTGENKPSCKGCHLEKELISSPPKNITAKKDGFVLLDTGGKLHPVPTMTDPAHFLYDQKVRCQSCHAQWTFNDTGKHYLRLDSDDFDSWSSLTTQGNVEVQTILENNIDFDKTEMAVQMRDKISGKMKAGIWLKGYSQRRWEEVLLGRDSDGKITTIRPVLDFSLSWVDKDDNVRFDSVMSHAANSGYLPYVPHTTGSAGIFYRQRIDRFLKSERSPLAK